MTARGGCIVTDNETLRPQEDRQAMQGVRCEASGERRGRANARGLEQISHQRIIPSFVPLLLTHLDFVSIAARIVIARPHQ